MPRYRLHADCFLNGSRFRAGAVVNFDGSPGSQMEPMDDAARAAFDAMLKRRQKAGMAPLTRFPFQLIESKMTGRPPRDPMDTSVPAHWRSLKGIALTNLAKRLGAPFGVNIHVAKAFLEDLERKQGKAIEPPQPPADEPNQALAAAADYATESAT